MNCIEYLSKLKYLSFIIALAFIFNACSSYSEYVKKYPEKKTAPKPVEKPKTDKEILPENVPAIKFSSSSNIRVLVGEKADNFTFSTVQNISMQDDINDIFNIAAGDELSFTTTTNNKVIVTINGTPYTSSYFILSAGLDSTINVAGKIYRGNLRFVGDNGTVKMINYLPLEEYLCGVVPGEMPVNNKPESREGLKAFVICARTYAYLQLKSGKSLYDVYADTRSQVYGGMSIEKLTSNQIIKETEGMMLFYNNKPATVFYSSTCGGYTEDASHAFNSIDQPYIKSYLDGEPAECSISPAFNWIENYSKEEIVALLYKAKKIESENYELVDLVDEARYPSGRIQKLIALLDQDGTEKEVSIGGRELRGVIRSKKGGILKSSKFNIEMTSDSVKLSGIGYGHGVGLCQFGCIARSKKGQSAEDILSFYFPGTEIKNIYVEN